MEEQEPTTRENPSLDESATVLHGSSFGGYKAASGAADEYFRPA